LEVAEAVLAAVHCNIGVLVAVVVAAVVVAMKIVVVVAAVAVVAVAVAAVAEIADHNIPYLLAVGLLMEAAHILDLLAVEISAAVDPDTLGLVPDTQGLVAAEAGLLASLGMPF